MIAVITTRKLLQPREEFQGIFNCVHGLSAWTRGGVLLYAGTRLLALARTFEQSSRSWQHRIARTLVVRYRAARRPKDAGIILISLVCPCVDLSTGYFLSNQPSVSFFFPAFPYELRPCLDPAHDRRLSALSRFFLCHRLSVLSDYAKYRKFREQTEKLAAQFQGLDGNKQA